MSLRTLISKKVVNKMLACTIEYESPNWRDGMSAGLSEGIHLGFQYREDEDRLHYELLRRIVDVAPRPYRRYLRAYYRQPLYPGIETKLLSYWQWRTYAAELAGLAVLPGCAPGDNEEALRSAVLLAPGEASAAPYQALLAADESVDPAPQTCDGYIDAAIYCSTLLDECDLTADEYTRAASELMSWLLPQDYLRYALRYIDRRAARQGQDSGAFYFPSPCRVQYWRCNVEALAAEVARCDAAGEGKSQLWLDLVAWLLLEPQEGVPNPDWEMPPAMAERLARLEKLSLLA
jgi:hypothetical protein